MKWVYLLPILLLLMPLVGAFDVDVSVNVTSAKPPKPVEYSLASIGIATSMIMLALTGLGYEFKSISDIVSLYVAIVTGVVILGTAISYFV